MAAARSTPSPCPAGAAAAGSVTPGFISVIIMVLYCYPGGTAGAGSSAEPALTEAALGFLFTYLCYSDGALPDSRRQPWPGGTGGQEAAPVGHFSDMLSQFPPLFPTLPFRTQSGGPPVSAAPWGLQPLCRVVLVPGDTGTWCCVVTPAAGVGFPNSSPHGKGLGCIIPMPSCVRVGMTPIQAPWLGLDGKSSRKSNAE